MNTQVSRIHLLDTVSFRYSHPCLMVPEEFSTEHNIRLFLFPQQVLNKQSQFLNIRSLNRAPLQLELCYQYPAMKIMGEGSKNLCMTSAFLLKLTTPPFPISQEMAANRSNRKRSVMAARQPQGPVLVMMFPLVPVAPFEFLKQFSNRAYREFGHEKQNKVHAVLWDFYS